MIGRRGSVSYFDLLMPNLAIKLLVRLPASDGSRDRPLRGGRDSRRQQEKKYNGSRQRRGGTITHAIIHGARFGPLFARGNTHRRGGRRHAGAECSTGALRRNPVHGTTGARATACSSVCRRDDAAAERSLAAACAGEARLLR